MILINNEWYNPKDLQDVLDIIREEFSYDLAHKLDELIQSLRNELKDENDYDLGCQIDDLNNEISSLEDDINDKDNEINELKEEIDELNERIKELEEKYEIK